MEYTIREALDRDEGRIVELGVEFWQFNRRQAPQSDDDTAVFNARARHLATVFANRDASHHFWVVEDDDGDLAGYAYAQVIEPAAYEDNGTEPVGLIDEVFLQERCRGGGLGRAVVKRMVEKLKNPGAVHIRLHSYAWNAPANRLYASMGFMPYAYSWQLWNTIPGHRLDVVSAASDLAMRTLREDDYPAIIAVLDQWWGGRAMSGLLPRLFFQHFQDTSWVIEDAGNLVAFLVGFISQTRRDEAYIHFVGVSPEYRGRGLGKQLYQTFFEHARAHGRYTVTAITSPINLGSVAFHTRMGFVLVPGDAAQNGIPVHTNYDELGGDRVVFRKRLMPMPPVP